MSDLAVPIDTPITVRIPAQRRAPRQVPLELVHRVRPEDAFPTSWRRLDETRFSVSARWPDNHQFYCPVLRWHDPLLVVETMRQASILVAHAGLGVPLGYHLLLSEMEYDCRSSELASAPGQPTRAGTDVEVEVACSQLKHRAGRLVQMRTAWEIRAGGRLLARGEGQARLTSPQVYRRLRAEHCTPVVSVPTAPPVPAELVGRTRVEDVLLSPTPRAGVWRLRADTRHATLFQRPNDHIPGMLLFEAARQAGQAVTAPEPFVPVTGNIVFYRYAEFGSPCWIQAQVVPGRAGGRATVQVSGHQQGGKLFLATLCGADLSEVDGLQALCAR